MPLAGAYSVTCTTCRSGGLSALYLIPQASVTSMTKGSGVTSYATITLISGGVWYTVDFEEDSAHWNETIEGEKGLFKVTEEVEIFLPGLSTASRNFVEDLLESSPCGMIAAVKDGCGTVWILGYTDRFTTTRPMKVVTVNSTTAKEFNDPTAGSTLTLRCTSNELAHVATATIVTS